MIPTRFKNKEAEYRMLMLNSGILEIWHDKDWQDYEGDGFYVDTVKNHALTAQEGMIMHGVNGTGKTMLMNLAFMEIFAGRKHKVAIIEFRSLIKQYTNNFRGESLLGMLLDCDYLGIDDVGKEFNSEMSKELASTALDYVLRHRWQRMKPTWITTNLNLEDFKKDYNSHIASLLKRSMVGLKIEGKDYGDKLFKKIVKPTDYGKS